MELDIEVVGASVSGEETLEMVRTLQPDVVLMDIILPETWTASPVTGQIKRTSPEVKVVPPTGDHQERYIFEALQIWGERLPFQGRHVAERQGRRAHRLSRRVAAGAEGDDAAHHRVHQR